MSRGPDAICAQLKRHWLAYSEALDHLLDLPEQQRRDWLLVNVNDPELNALLIRALNTVTNSPLDKPISAVHADTSATPEAIFWPDQIGTWQLQRPLGEGGSATVFLVRRLLAGTEQFAALKLLRTGLLDQEAYRRFTAERELLARLRHPGIAQLIDGGVTPTGMPYLVLEYVNGDALTSYCVTHQLPEAARLALFQRALEAVHYAHRNLIVHRDLKPANIMVDREGHLKLLDFGIARTLADSAAHTRTEARRLTLAYAAPEQITGGPVTTAIDIYAMGVLLHELITGILPKSSHQLVAVTQRPRHAFVDSRKPDRGLSAIIATAMAEDPEQRYESAAAFADDLRRYVQDLPLSAKGVSVWYQAFRNLRRHWVKLTAFGAVVVVISVFAGIAARESATSRALAERESATRQFLVDLLALAAPEQAQGKATHLIDVIKRGSEHARSSFGDAPATRAEVLRVTGQLLDSMGELAAAERDLRLALHIEQDTNLWQGQASPRTLLALVGVLRDRNRLQEAGNMSAALVARLRQTREDEAVLAAALVLEGTLHSRDEQHELGIRLLEEGLARQKAIVGADADAIADAERMLGDALARAGQAEAAMAHWEEALARVPDRSLLKSRLLLSMAYGNLQLGAFTLADQQLQEATRMQSALLPEANTDRAQTLTAEAVLATARGDEEHSLTLHREALRIRALVFGGNSVEAGESQVAVAISLGRLGQYERSLSAFAQGIQRFQHSQEPPVGQLAWALSNQSLVLSESGAHAAAISLGDQALATLGPDYAADNATRLAFQLAHVDVLRRAGSTDAAIALIQAAYKATSEPKWHRRFLLAEAKVEQSRENHIRANALISNILRYPIPQYLPAEHAEAWLLRSELARAANQPAAAEAALQEAMALFAHVLPEEHPRWLAWRATAPTQRPAREATTLSADD